MKDAGSWMEDQERVSLLREASERMKNRLSNSGRS